MAAKREREERERKRKREAQEEAECGRQFQGREKVRKGCRGGEARKEWKGAKCEGVSESDGPELNEAWRASGFPEGIHAWR